MTNSGKQTNSAIKEIDLANAHLQAAITRGNAQMADIVGPLVYLHAATGELLECIKTEHPKLADGIDRLLRTCLKA